MNSQNKENYGIPHRRTDHYLIHDKYDILE